MRPALKAGALFIPIRQGDHDVGRWPTFLVYHHFEEVKGGVEPWLMARWKARVDFLLRVIELLLTPRRNARIASAVLATAIPSACFALYRLNSKS